MKKILALAGSNNSESINYKLINYTAIHLAEYEVEILDIRKWIIPIYSQDMDKDNITPIEINLMCELIKTSDGFIISVPEHNEGATAFFKNIIDWLTRRSAKVMEDKPVLLLSTSTGRRGAMLSREYHERTLPRIGAKIVASHGVPSFNHSMIDGKLVTEEQGKLLGAIAIFKEALGV